MLQHDEVELNLSESDEIRKINLKKKIIIKISINNIFKQYLNLSYILHVKENDKIFNILILVTFTM